MKKKKVLIDIVRLIIEAIVNVLEMLLVLFISDFVILKIGIHDITLQFWQAVLIIIFYTVLLSVIFCFTSIVIYKIFMKYFPKQTEQTDKIFAALSVCFDNSKADRVGIFLINFINYLILNHNNPSFISNKELYDAIFEYNKQLKGEKNND